MLLTDGNPSNTVITYSLIIILTKKQKKKGKKIVKALIEPHRDRPPPPLFFSPTFSHFPSLSVEVAIFSCQLRVEYTQYSYIASIFPTYPTRRTSRSDSPIRRRRRPSISAPQSDSHHYSFSDVQNKLRFWRIDHT